MFFHKKLVLIAFFVVSTHSFAFAISSYTLEIDSNLSKITYKTNNWLISIDPIDPIYQIDPTNLTYLTNPSDVTNLNNPSDAIQQETFSISGKFNIIVDSEYYYTTVLRFEPISITTESLPWSAFLFPTYLVRYDGLNFADNDDPCNTALWDPWFSGMCWSQTSFGPSYVSGSFDGTTLEMTGKAPFSFWDFYEYTIHASVVENSPVPEPSAFVLFGSAVLAFGAIRMRISKNRHS